MICSRELIEGYVDEELDFALKAEVEAHLATCGDCAELCRLTRERQNAIRSQIPYYRAPAGLEQSIRSALASAHPTSPWKPYAIAASVLLALSLGWNVDQFRQRARQPDLIADNVLFAHIRSLLGNHLLDVESTDRHTVKPWFNGRLDFSPVVLDLKNQGFPLIGGRADYLAGRTVAALVYRRGNHVINLFTWPSTANAGESSSSRNGYNELHWSAGSMTYWAVSDLAPADLNQFKSLYMVGAAGP